MSTFPRYTGPEKQGPGVAVRFHKMAFTNLGYSAFLRELGQGGALLPGDVFLHSETGCKLRLEYTDTKVQNWERSGLIDELRPARKGKTESLHFTIDSPYYGEQWEGYASSPEHMEEIIGLKARHKSWSRWIVVGRVARCGINPIAICTLDDLRVAWNSSLLDGPPANTTMYRPPPEGTGAEVVRDRMILARLSSNQAAALTIPQPDPDILALQLQDLQSPTPQYAPLFPSTRRGMPNHTGPIIPVASQVHQAQPLPPPTVPATHQGPQQQPMAMVPATQQTAQQYPVTALSITHQGHPMQNTYMQALPQAHAFQHGIFQPGLGHPALHAMQQLYPTLHATHDQAAPFTQQFQPGPQPALPFGNNQNAPANPVFVQPGPHHPQQHPVTPHQNPQQQTQHHAQGIPHAPIHPPNQGQQGSSNNPGAGQGGNQQ